MDAQINQWLNDPDMLIYAGGGLLLIGLLLILLLLRRRKTAVVQVKPDSHDHPLVNVKADSRPNPFADNLPKTKPYAPFPHKAFDVAVDKSSASLHTFLNQAAPVENHSVRDFFAPPLKSDQEKMSKVVDRHNDKPKAEKALAPSPVNNQPLPENTNASRNFLNSTRMPLSGDMLLSLIQKGTKIKATPNFEGLIKNDHPEPVKAEHFNSLLKKIRSTFMGKAQPKEEIDPTPPEMLETPVVPKAMLAPTEAMPSVNVSKSSSDKPEEPAMLSPQESASLDSQALSHPSESSESPIQRVAADMLDASSPTPAPQTTTQPAEMLTVDETQFPPAGDTLLQLLKSHKKLGEDLSTLQPQAKDRYAAPVDEAIAPPSAEAVPEETQEAITEQALPLPNAYLTEMIASSANIMKAAESMPMRSFTQTRLTPSTVEPSISSTKPEAVFAAHEAEMPKASSTLEPTPAAPLSATAFSSNVFSQTAEQQNATQLPPSMEHTPHEDADLHPSITSRAFSMLPFGMFKKTTQSAKAAEPSFAPQVQNTPPVPEAASVANTATTLRIEPPKAHFTQATARLSQKPAPTAPLQQNLPTILRPTPTQENHRDRQDLTAVMPQAVENVGKVDRFDQVLAQLELEAKKALENISLNHDQGLPPLLQGLVQPVQAMMNQAQAQALLLSLSHQQYGDVRAHLNDIVNKQTEIFLAWRRSFGKFSRLFSVIAMNEDWNTAYKSMKKATELDPSESWNWYALALIAAELERPDEHAALLDKALSVAVAETPTLSVVEALKRPPIAGEEHAFTCSIIDKATHHAAKAEWAEAKNLLGILLDYFHEHSPKTPYLQEQRLSSALRLAKWQQNSKAFSEAIDTLSAALAETYCQAQLRLKVLLGLIELRHEGKISPDICEPWFHEATALILSFPQHHEGGAQYYRTLAHYHLDHEAFDQAEPLLQSALKLDQTHHNDVDEAHDWHGLAQVAKGRKQPQAAFDCWQHADALMQHSDDLQRFSPRLQGDVHLAIGEMLLESNQMLAATPHLEQGAAQLVLLAPALTDGQRLAHLAALLFVRKQYPLSQKLYQAAKTMLQQEQRSSIYCEVILSLAHCWFYMKDFSASEVALKEAQALLKQSSNPLRSAQAFVLMGLINEVLQKPHKALESCHEALAQLKPMLGNAQNHANMSEISPILKTVFACMGRCYLQMGHAQAAKMLRNALVYCLPKDEERLEIEQQLALALLNQNDNAEALELLESCLQGASQRNDLPMQWDISVQMARGLMRLGSLDRAEGLLRQVHEQSRLAGDAATQAKTAGAFGEFYLAKNQIDTALSFYQQAVQYHHKANQPLDEANEQVKWAEVLIKHGRGQEAEPLLKQAEKVLNQLGAERKAAEALIALAKILLKHNRGEEAEGYYQRAVGLWERLDAPERTAEELSSLGILKMRRGKHSEARKDWLKAKQMFQQLGKHESALNVNNWLEMLGDNA